MQQALKTKSVPLLFQPGVKFLFNDTLWSFRLSHALFCSKTPRMVSFSPIIKKDEPPSFYIKHLQSCFFLILQNLHCLPPCLLARSLFPLLARCALHFSEHHQEFELFYLLIKTSLHRAIGSLHALHPFPTLPVMFLLALGEHSYTAQMCNHHVWEFLCASYCPSSCAVCNIKSKEE